MGFAPLSLFPPLLFRRGGFKGVRSITNQKRTKPNNQPYFQFFHPAVIINGTNHVYHLFCKYLKGLNTDQIVL